MINSKYGVITNEYSFNFKYVDLCAEMFNQFNFDKFLEYTEKNCKEIHNLIAIEYYLLKMHLNKDFDESNKKVEEIFLVNKGKGSEYIALFMIGWINAFVYQINLRAAADKIPELAEKALKIAEIYIEKKLYKFYNVYFNISYFVYFIRIASLAQKGEWIQQFIINNENDLDPSSKEYAVNYAWGIYYLTTQNYSKALEYYSRVKHPDAGTFIKLRYEMMICHFALGNYETSLSINQALLKSLEQKFKGSKSQRELIDEVKLFRKLISAVTDPNTDKFDWIKINLQKLPPRAQITILNFIRKLESK